MSSKHTGEVETNEKEKNWMNTLSCCCTRAHQYQPLNWLSFCWKFAFRSLGFLFLPLFSPLLTFFLFSSWRKKLFSSFFSLLVSLINVQLICMMARNNIFLWLNIPATGQTMKAIPISTQEWVGEGTKSFTIVGGRRKIRIFPSSSLSTTTSTTGANSRSTQNFFLLWCIL